MNQLLRFDVEFMAKHGVFCGVDEAGRGPLAGDVFAAAVVLPLGECEALNESLKAVRDSKKLSEKVREKLFEEIKSVATAWCIATASVEEIEQLNIRNAAFLAMERAVKGMNFTADLALIDGDGLPKNLPCAGITQVKGDDLSMSVAAASILAKVARDRYMRELGEKYPAYGFAANKGYGTKQHIEALKVSGPCPAHRQLFIRKWVNEV